jgi:hypothetical protein
MPKKKKVKRKKEIQDLLLNSSFCYPGHIQDLGGEQFFFG